jgi:cation diffusion facilitator family transporter
MDTGSKKAIYAAFGANLGIAIAKFVGFGITGAASMLAEAVHSVADTGNQGLLLLGSYRASRKATAEHPFGFGQERYFWAFVVAVVIFVLGGVFAITEGIDKLRQPHEIEKPLVAIGILVLGIFLEGYSFRTAIIEANKRRGTRSLWEFIRRTKNAELPVVILEDFGALVGLTLALIGVGLAQITGESRFDALGSISIGVLLCLIAAVLSREMRSLLIGEAARPAQVEAISEALLSGEYVRQVIHVRTLHLGPEQILVAAKLEFDPAISFAALAEEIDRVEAAVLQAVPICRLIYIEPDLYKPASAGASSQVGD